MKSFLTMLGFFTRIPVRVNYENGQVFDKGIKYLFLVALIIGAPVALLFMTGEWTGRYIAAFLSLALYLFLSGGLHIDGLADTADAFGSNAGKQRMQQIMKDSRIGTFGVLAICIYIAGMVLFLAQADYIIAGFFPLVGRTAALLCAKMFNCARQDGLGKSFAQAVKGVHIIWAIAVYTVIALLFCFDFSARAFDFRYMIILFAPYAVSLLITVLTVYNMSKKLHGITGDIIGFCIEESSFIYILAAGMILKLL